MSDGANSIKFVEENGDAYLTDGQLSMACDIGRDIAIFKKQINALRGSPLYKALGKPKVGTKVIDATFGGGKDSASLLALGLKVDAYERNELIFKLARSYLDKTPIDDLKLTFGQCRDADQFDSTILYFDPMFESSRHKSLSKKEMEIFRKATTNDPDDADQFLAWALEQNFERIVVKRSLKAPHLCKKKPICSFKGKSVRFDLYRSIKS